MPKSKSRKKKAAPKRILALPDVEHAKTAEAARPETVGAMSNRGRNGVACPSLGPLSSRSSRSKRTGARAFGRGERQPGVAGCG